MSAVLDASRDFEWSTDSVRGSSALSCWMDRVGACLTEVDIESRAFGGHRARIQHFELGPVQLNFLSATSQRIVHSTAMIKHSANDYLLLFFEKGAGRLRHYDLEVTAPEKCFVLLDNQQPYELVRDTGGITLSMRLEDAWLRHWLPQALLQRLAAVRGRLSLCADQAAAAKWWLSMPMASVSAEGPMPKALSTRRTSPLMPGCRHQGRACPLRRARMTSNPLIVA